MYKTAQQLIREAHEVANSLPPASAAILKEVASRLDVSVAALIQVCDERSAVINTITAIRVNSGCPEGVDVQDWVKQLAAENVGLKAGVTYFAYSPEYGFDYFKDKQSAIDTAQAEIDAYREDADDGWSEDVQRVSWGVVIQQAQGFDAQELHTSDSQHTYQTCDYRLVDSVATPATDRIYAGIKADGVELFAKEMHADISVDDAREFAQQLREVSANG